MAKTVREQLVEAAGKAPVTPKANEHTALRNLMTALQDLMALEGGEPAKGDATSARVWAAADKALSDAATVTYSADAPAKKETDVSEIQQNKRDKSAAEVAKIMRQVPQSFLDFVSESYDEDANDYFWQMLMGKETAWNMLYHVAEVYAEGEVGEGTEEEKELVGKLFGV